jgi:hypothetical protein
LWVGKAINLLFYLLQHFDDQKIVTREVKSLADSIISNAESNGYIPVKRSFVEEVNDRASTVFMKSKVVTAHHTDCSLSRLLGPSKVFEVDVDTRPKPIYFPTSLTRTGNPPTPKRQI